MHFCMDEMALRSQIFVDKSGLIEKNKLYFRHDYKTLQISQK